MKRLLIGLLVVSMLLVGCSNNSNNEDNNALNDMNNSVVESKNNYADYNSADEMDTEETSSEQYTHRDENEVIDTQTEAVSTFSIDVDTASYANLRDLITGGYEPNPDAVRIEEMINYFNYDYDGPEEDLFSVTTKITDTPWNEESMIAMIGIKGMELDYDEIPSSNIVMLIDVSGSMNAENKLPLLKQSFKALVNNLTENDRVSMVVYAGSAGVVLDGAVGSDRHAIMEAIDKLEAGGSTAGGEGIELAYSIAKKHFIEGGNNRVILATDGDFNVGINNPSDLEKFIAEKREDDIFLSVVGFGRGNTRDDIMESLADNGNGNYSYIDTLTEANKVFGEEFLGTVFAIAKDVKVQVKFNADAVASYRLIGYENRVMANEDFTNDKKDAGELGSGHEVTALYEIELHDNVDLGQTSLYELEFRYKEPTHDQSRSMVYMMEGNPYVEDLETDRDLHWALTVTEFGLILKDSEYRGTANIERVKETAAMLAGKDQDFYKTEFSDLVNRYSEMIQQ